MQDVRERTQGKDIIFVSPVLRASTSLVLEIFISLVSSDIYVHIFHALCQYGYHLLKGFMEM